MENRRQMVEHCIETKQIVVNTMFKKPNHKLVTWAHATAKPDSPLQRHRPSCNGKFDTLDYWLTPQRWKNSVLNCESDRHANINSNHYPLTVTLRLKLKAQKLKRYKTKAKYEKANETQQKQ